MKPLLVTGPLYPQPGNNANLAGKLISFLNREHELHIMAPAFGKEPDCLPDTVFGVPVHWVTDSKRGLMRRMVYPAVSKIVDPNGYSDALQAMILLDAAKRIRKEFPFDTVIATSEPYCSAFAASQLPKVKKVLYIMDPPKSVCEGGGTPFRIRSLGELLKRQDLLLTTPFIQAALRENGYTTANTKIVPVGFPMIEYHETAEISGALKMDSNKINLLFCGWLYSDIRSPEYFLKLVSYLDERFCIYFMGKECEKLRERFSFQTRVQIITLSQQPYSVALCAMRQADVLVNIGNSVPVHMPSKTLEYINTGKPVVNFYKMMNCPTLYYTKRYPLCLNIYEGDKDIDEAARIFQEFCLIHRGDTVNRAYIEQEFHDCTPQYIAQIILNKLGDNNV